MIVASLQCSTENERNRRRDLVAVLRSQREQMLASLKREAPRAARDTLLGGASAGGGGGAVAAAGPGGRETEATAELGNRGLLAMQQQVMQQQDDALESLERSVVGTKHIALQVRRVTRLPGWVVLGWLPSFAERLPTLQLTLPLSILFYETNKAVYLLTQLSCIVAGHFLWATPAHTALSALSREAASRLPTCGHGPPPPHPPTPHPPPIHTDQRGGGAAQPAAGRPGRGGGGHLLAAGSGAAPPQAGHAAQWVMQNHVSALSGGGGAGGGGGGWLQDRHPPVNSILLDQLLRHWQLRRGPGGGNPAIGVVGPDSCQMPHTRRSTSPLILAAWQPAPLYLCPITQCSECTLHVPCLDAVATAPVVGRPVCPSEHPSCNLQPVTRLLNLFASPTKEPYCSFDQKQFVILSTGVWVLASGLLSWVRGILCSPAALPTLGHVSISRQIVPPFSEFEQVPSTWTIPSLRIAAGRGGHPFSLGSEPVAR